MSWNVISFVVSSFFFFSALFDSVAGAEATAFYRKHRHPMQDLFALLCLEFSGLCGFLGFLLYYRV